MPRFPIIPIFALLVLLIPASAKADCGQFSGVAPWQSPPYNPALLVKTYECVSAVYHSNKSYINYSGDILEPLARAGVQTLLTNPGGVTALQRVQILNDYGFWLYKQGFTYMQAAAVLEAVVKLAPERALAWLNLGDTYAAMLTSAVEDDGIPKANSTWSGKQELTRKAVDAYERYVSLSASPVQHVRDFLALNILNAPQENVCQFVTAFVRQNREQELAINQYTDVIPVDLLGDGVKYYVYIYYTGSSNIPDIAAYTSPQKDVGPYYSQWHPSDVDFDPLDFLSGDGGGTSVNPGDSLYLLLFKNLYYVLRVTFSDANAASDPIDRPVDSAQIVQPNNGVVCGIKARLSPVLSVGQGDPVCDHFLAGSSFDQPAVDNSLADQNIKLGPRGLGADYDLTSTVKADLENDGHPLDFAYYDFESGAGAGCGQKGIVPFDPVALKEKIGPLDDGLRRLPIGCDGGQDYVITWKGRTYLELDHGPDLQPGEARGAGIYEVEDDVVNPVCIIENRFQYDIEYNR